MKFRRRVSMVLVLCLLLTLWAGMGSWAGFALEGDSAGQTKNDQEEAAPGEVPDQGKDSGGDGTFTDIRGHWAEDAIVKAAEQKLVGGYPDGSFQPDRPIKREEFFTLLSNILTEKPDTTKTVLSFSDVVPGEWYVAVIKTAVAGGMTSGYPDGTFGIGKSMTREEAAQVAASVIPREVNEDSPGADTAKDEALISDWAYNAVDLMFRKGYMKGDTEGNFRPSAALTRAEATQILLNISENEPIICSTAQEQADYQQMLESLKYGCASTHLPTNATGEMDTSQESLSKLPQGIFKKGSGTAADPYLVTTQEQLNHIREHNQENVYFQLDADISVTEDFATEKPGATEALADWRVGNWTPLGNSKDAPFLAHLDGNGHTIRGLNVNCAGLATITSGEAISKKNLSSDATGFIGYLGKSGSVTDLTIDKSTMENPGRYTGAIAGYAQGAIKNCATGEETEVKGDDRSGGIVGYSEGLLEACENRAIVKAERDGAGGIAGEYAMGGVTLKDCTNEGTVKGGLQIGGIVGILSGNNGGITVSDCTNRGAVTAAQGMAGGIVGGNGDSRCTITACVNEGKISGNNSGGITGKNEGIVSLCRNEGMVTGRQYIGGIIGFQSADKAKVFQCVNSGEIVGEEDGINAGGIAGESDTIIYHCYNTGDVSGSSNVGGITGKSTGQTLNSYSVGEIDGKSGVGGVVGSSSGSVTGCFWLKGTADSGVGMKGSTSSDRVYGVTEEILRGKAQVRTYNGNEELLDVLNDDPENPVWKQGTGKYDFPILINQDK